MEPELSQLPHYAAANFSYAATVPDGTIGHAGINDGVQSALNFTGLNTPSVDWRASSATAGHPFALHWVATAPHDPSYFEVYITRQGFDVTKGQLTWAALENLGRWALNDPARPVTNGTAPSPAGGNSLSYDWSIPIPADRSGRNLVVVIWQRQDPAGEAFFAVQDLDIAAAPTDDRDMLKITREADATVHLELRAAPNAEYAIEQSDDIAAGEWRRTITGTTDGSGRLLATDTPGATLEARFYRAVKSPAQAHAARVSDRDDSKPSSMLQGDDL